MVRKIVALAALVAKYNELKLKLAAEKEKWAIAEANHQATKEVLKDVAPWPVKSTVLPLGDKHL